MKYNILINQKAIIDSGLDLDLVDAALIDFIMAFINSGKVQKIIIGDHAYFWLNYKHILTQIPMINIKSGNAIYKRLKKLEDMGLLVSCPQNQALKKPYYRVGSRMRSLYFTSDQDHESALPGTSQPLSQARATSAQDHEDNNIIDNNINDNERQAPKKSKGFQQPSEIEVHDYMTQMIGARADVEAKKFINFYSSKNWMVGKNHMTRWKNAASNWVLRVLEDKKNNTNGRNYQGRGPTAEGTIESFEEYDRLYSGGGGK